MIHYILILVLLIGAFFFTAMEVAFVSANKLRIELDRKQDRHFSQIIELYTSRPAQYYATIITGNILIMTLLATITHIVAVHHFANLAPNILVVLSAQIVVAMLLYLTAGEILPKLFFRRESAGVLKMIALPAALFYYLFFLISRIVFGFSKLIVNRFPNKHVANDDPAYWGAVDWDSLFKKPATQVQSDEESNDVKLFRNALDFSNVKLRECMVPRPEIVAISVTDTIPNLNRLFISSGLSKIIVYKGSIDNIIGFAPSISMFRKATNIADITRDLPIVPETMPANKLLALFIQNRRSIALVVDEFGGTSGIVTMEDILEEIVGDIQDEHDKKRYREHRLSSNHFLFSARLEIDYINEKYELNIPTSEEYETLAGLILAHYGAIPKVKDVVAFDQFKFTILRASSTKIELVDLVIEP
ncbi:MAG: HlyC/CorC family transporter [Salinivirgaceae bacterium]|nr:HlyC/CorC family transporter [Salinivirgaceae bacterium]